MNKATEVAKCAFDRRKAVILWHTNYGLSEFMRTSSHSHQKTLPFRKTLWRANALGLPWARWQRSKYIHRTYIGLEGWYFSKRSSVVLIDLPEAGSRDESTARRRGVLHEYDVSDVSDVSGSSDSFSDDASLCIFNLLKVDVSQWAMQHAVHSHISQRGQCIDAACAFSRCSHHSTSAHLCNPVLLFDLVLAVGQLGARKNWGEGLRYCIGRFF